MDNRIEAIYENGVFKPLTEVALPNQLRVVLRIEPEIPDAADVESVARQQRAMAALDAELEHVPDNSPDDGLSSADHDRILYGARR